LIDQQGDWDESVDFQINVKSLVNFTAVDGQRVEYRFGDLGGWAFEISAEEVESLV
jgi:hypothetical protein